MIVTRGREGQSLSHLVEDFDAVAGGQTSTDSGYGNAELRFHFFEATSIPRERRK
jgi:hypothetical protein